MKKKKKYKKRKRKKVKYNNQSKQNTKNKVSSIKKKKLKKSSVFSTLIISFFGVLTIYISLFFLFFRLGMMDGDSMQPAVNSKDIVIVNKYETLKRFDLVYMRTPLNEKEITVKRVIGLPKESVQYSEDELLINGQEKSEPYLEEKKEMYPGVIFTEDFNLGDVTNVTSVPQGSYFVLGDNRKSSVDSRIYGFVDETLIIGKVKMRVFPFSSFTIF